MHINIIKVSLKVLFICHFDMIMVSVLWYRYNPILSIWYTSLLHRQFHYNYRDAGGPHNIWAPCGVVEINDQKCPLPPSTIHWVGVIFDLFFTFCGPAARTMSILLTSRYTLLWLLISSHLQVIWHDIWGCLQNRGWDFLGDLAN